MATSYLATADVNAVIGDNVRQALFTEEGGTYDSTQYDRAVELASMMARSALENAGYAPGESTSNDMVTITALSFFLHMAYGRKKMEIPASVSAIFAGVPEGVRVGEVPIPGLSPDELGGVGGSEFTDSTSTSGKPRIFKNLRTLF